ncbi:MAG: hypothetical protein CFE24_06450 [Flavobacterium sp. BFFFF2]|nr:MAG: hypothetical protein CFE24_06450 [Flavobacterium sp. BFFFF2]
MNTKMLKLLLGCFCFFTMGCTHFLDENSPTDLNNDFIYKTPEGLQFAVVAMYNFQRDMANFGAGEGSLPANSLIGGDDITFTRAGESLGDWAGCTKYDPNYLNSLNKDVEGYWNYNYKLVGRANEIAFYALKMDQSNPLVKQALCEAYCFRALAYFNLLRRYDNIYFTTNPALNSDQEVNYAPANQADVMNQIKQDLDYAIANLAWTTPELGRFTKGFACHVKSLADLWPINGDPSTMDLTDAAAQVETILASNTYSLMNEPKDVFAPISTSSTSAKLNNSEAIFVHQWSNEIGGAAVNSSNSLTGHRFASSSLTRYDKNTVFSVSDSYSINTDLEQGGVTWGRFYPNDYLLSLYDQATDKRYTQYYRNTFTFNNIPSSQPLTRSLVIQSHDIKYLFVNGQPNTNMGLSTTILQQLQNYGPTGAVNKTLNFTFRNGDAVPKFMSPNIAQYMRPSSTKYFDKWTRDITINPSFKDIIVYRLAETYLVGAEAYLRAGNMGKAVDLFNKVWTRAGNTPKTSITLQDILDEDAREFGQEGFGHRWYTLKRFGAATMEQQIKKYAGCLYNDNINGYVFKTPMDFYSYLNRINYNAGNRKTDIITNINTAKIYDDARDNFDVTKHIRWPIPQNQINAMGGNFPQNIGYN